MTTRYRVTRVRFATGRQEYTAQRRTWFGLWVNLRIPGLMDFGVNADVDTFLSSRFSSMAKAVDAIEDVKATKRDRKVLKKKGKPVVVWLDGVEVKPFSEFNEQGAKVFRYWKR